MNTSFVLLMLFAAVAQVRAGEGELVVSCSTAGEGLKGYVGGIGIYREAHDLRGVLRARISDNYMSGYLTCMADDKEGDDNFLCGGVWNTYGRGVETVQARLRKTETDGVYSFDLSRRPRFYGGEPLRSVKCRSNR